MRHTELESKSTRDYIRMYGRVAARQRHTQIIEVHSNGLQVGQIDVLYCTDEGDFVWHAFAGVDHSNKRQCYSYNDARTFILSLHQAGIDMTFGDWLDAMMSKHRLTQATICDAVGISRVTLHHWLTDERLPNVANWHQVAEVMSSHEQCTLTDMLGQMSTLDLQAGDK
jgi:hypothetical protein